MRGTALRKLGILFALVAGLLLVLQLVVPPLLRKPLARWVEQAADAQLRGYRLQVGAVDLDPLGLGVKLRDLALLQDDDASEPPLLRVPEGDAGIAFSGLLRFRTWTTVRNASIELDPARLRAVLEADLGPQLLTLGRDAVDLLAEHRGALGTIDVEAASLHWTSPEGELALPAVEARIENASGQEAGGADDRYVLQLEARPPQPGTIRAHGEIALFAAELSPTNLSFDLEGLQLAWLAPLAERARLDVRSGILSARGRIELGDRRLRIELAEASLDDADIDWRHTARTWVAEQRALEAATDRLRALLEGWDLAFAAKQIEVRRSTFGVQDASADPPYRLFVTVESAAVRGVASASRDRPTTFTAEGQPMGTGRFVVEGRARTDAGGPDIELELEVREVALPALNDALVAHGAIGLQSGRFSLELGTGVRDGRISGYAIPLFENVSAREKEDAGLARRVLEATVDAITGVLENERGDIATRTSLSGTLANPEIGIWEAVIGLLRNAFVEAIAPQFEREIGAD